MTRITGLQGILVTEEGRGSGALGGGSTGSGGGPQRGCWNLTA